MRVGIRSVLIPATLCAIVALAALTYAGTGSVTAAPESHAAKVHKLSRAQELKKLKKALRACAKKHRKSSRRACETKARRRYPGKSLPRHKTGHPAEPEPPATETPAQETPAPEGPTPEERAKIAAELERAHSASNMPSAELVAKGQGLFASSCASCHGMNGREGTNLAETCACAQPIFTLAQSVGGVMQELIEPAQGTMPDFDKNFTLEEKEALGAYVCVDVTDACPAPTT